jgi:formylmethanofuran dehydrogenase subunit E
MCLLCGMGVNVMKDEETRSRIRCERCNEFGWESEMEESSYNEQIICPACIGREFDHFCFQQELDGNA